MPQFINPGDAAGQAFTDFLTEREVAKQRALTTQIAQQRLQMEGQREDRLSRLEELQIQEQRAKNARQEHEDITKGIKDEAANLMPGDIPDADFIARAKAAHVPLPLKQGPDQVAAPANPQTPTPGQQVNPGNPGAPVASPPPSLPGSTPVMGPGGMRFVGTPQQRAEVDKQKGLAEQKAKAQQLLESLPPDSPERKELEFFLVTGKQLPAGIFKSTQAPEPEAVYRIGRDGKMAQIGSVPKGSHFASEPAPPQPDSTQLVPEVDPKTGLQTGRYMAYDPKKRGFSTVNGPTPIGTKGPPPATDPAKLTPSQEVAFKAIVERKTKEASGILPRVLGGAIDDATQQRIMQEAFDEAKKIQPGASGVANPELDAILKSLDGRKK